MTAGKFRRALWVGVLLIFSSFNHFGGPGNLFGDSNDTAGSQAAAQRVAMKAGSDWGSARRVENVPWSIDTDPTVSRLTQLVKKNPAENLHSLVDALVAGKRDDFERVRAIHDWIARNIAYDWAAYQNKGPTITDPLQVIRHGSSICYGYAQVFSTMCSMAGIRAEVVEGYGRGIGFDPFGEDNQPYKSQHAWNAVLIGGGWYLVDTTWDAGWIDSGTNDFAWHYSTGYLFTPPEVFLCTHFPDDSKWQLRETPLDLKQLRSQPKLEGEFGKQGVTLGGVMTRVTAAEAEQEIVVQAPPSIRVRGFLKSEGMSASQLMSQVGVRQEGGAVHMNVMFPAAGRYTLELWAYKGGEPNPSLNLGELFFVATEGSPRRAASLTQDSASSDLTIEGADGYIYRVASRARFAFSGKMDALVSLQDQAGKIVGNRVSISREGDRRIVTVAFPQPGEYSVIVSVPSRIQANAWTWAASLSFAADAGSDLEFPQLTDRGRKAGLEPSSAEGYDPRVGAETQVSFNVTGKFQAALLSGNASLQGRAFVQSDGDRRTVRVSFPQPGEFVLWVWVASEKPNGWEAAVSYHFISTGSGGVYPVVFDGGTGLGFQVVGPLEGELTSGQDTTFEVRGPAEGIVTVVVSNRRVSLTGIDGRFRGTVRPSGSTVTVFCAGTADGALTGLARYTVR